VLVLPDGLQAPGVEGHSFEVSGCRGFVLRARGATLEEPAA
jgi:hypothetical protein